MKKAMLLAVLAAFVAGCASTTNTPTTTANQTLTLDEALQKSAETRQKLEEAKQTYQNAKNASAVASGASNSITDAVKTQVQKQLDTSKTQVNNEVQAWKDVFAD
jgi:uncharacterized protein YcfL